MTTSARRAIIVLVACATCLTLTGCGPSAKQRVDLVADRVLREHYGKNGGDTTVGEKEISALRAIGPGAVAPLIALLEDEDEWARRFAVSALGELRSPKPEVLRAVIDTLDDESFYVRWAATLALGQTPGPVSVRAPAAVKMLGDDSLTAQANGLTALLAMGAGALDAAMPIVAGLEAKARHRFLHVLPEFPDPPQRKLAALRTFLDDPDEEVRVRALRAVEGVDAPYEMLAPLLVVGLADEYPSVREAAVYTYMAVGAPRGELGAVLLLALDQPDVSFRGEIVSALADMGSAVLPELIQTLSHAEQRMRIGALRVLGEFEDPIDEAVPKLIDLLADEDSLVRRRAASTLLTHRSTRAMEAVARYHVSVLGRTKIDPGLKHPSVIVLAGIGGPAVQFLIPALDDADTRLLRRGAAFALGAIGVHGRDAAPRLMAMLRHDDVWHVRQGAAYALGRIDADPTHTVPALIAAFDDASLTVRQEAVDSLVAIGEPALPDLVNALREGSPDAKARAKQTLAAMGAPAVRTLADEIATYGPR